MFQTKNICNTVLKNMDPVIDEPSVRNENDQFGHPQEQNFPSTLKNPYYEKFLWGNYFLHLKNFTCKINLRQKIMSLG